MTDTKIKRTNSLTLLVHAHIK